MLFVVRGDDGAEVAAGDDAAKTSAVSPDEVLAPGSAYPLAFPDHEEMLRAYMGVRRACGHDMP